MARIFAISFVIFIFYTQNALAYGIDTHAALTQEIFNFYNQHFSQNKISDALKDFLIDGARREDDLPRFWNHFYDPVYDRGLNDLLYGKGYASKVWSQDSGKQNEIVYKVGGTIASILTAFQQRKLSEISTETDYTWQKAIEYYVNGEPEKAMFTLGHVLHLMEDSSVPAHTRNDGHPAVLGDEDPYEVWAYRFNKDNIHESVEKYIKDKQPFVFDNLNAYFNSMASYSNNNFYSGDTIGIQSGYDKPQVDPTSLIRDGIYFYAMAKDNEFGDYHLLAYKKVPKKYTWAYESEITLDDEGQDFILDDYWFQLSTKAIQHGAGVINLFFQEVERAKAEGKYQEKQKSFIGQLVDSVTGFVGNIFSGGEADTVIPIGERQETFEEQLLDTQEEEGVETAAAQKCKFDTSQTPSRRNIIINEIAWMGNKDSANSEWIELKNTSGQNLDISGYQIIDQSEQIQITISNNSLIPVGNFYLLERDNDATLPGIRADFIYKGPLSNTNEGLRLFDKNCNLIDEVFASPNWPAGNNITKQTMEWGKDLSWHTSVKVSGTPKQENSEPKEEEIVKEEIKEEIDELAEEIGPISSISPTSSTNQISPISPIGPISSCSFSTTKSPNHQKLIINEVAWMGTPNDSNDEWIELKNISTSQVDISGHQLLDKAEQIKIIFENGTKISANGFYILERTDDSTLLNISADKIYTGALANTNEGLHLFDSQCNLVDGVLAEPNWPAGDNTTKQTMERKSDLFWQTSRNSGGTPKTDNSSGVVTYSGGGGGGGSNVNQQQMTNNTTTTATSTPGNASNHIVISEIYPDKTGNNYDFIELYNPNDSIVDLSVYSLRILRQDATSSESLAIFSGESNTQMPSKGFFLISFSKYNENDLKTADISRSYQLPSTQSAKIILQNGEITIDEYQYDAGNLNDGQSFERKAYSNSFCISAQNDGEFLGNGCDTDSSGDWEIRASANPQNSQSLPEPREAPAAVTNFTLGYHFSVPTLTMSWGSSSDYSGVTSTLSYRIAEINSSSSAPLNFNTTSTVSDQKIYEIGRRYEISVKAIDVDGLASTSTVASVDVPSFINSAYFYRHPDASSTYYLVDLYYDNYPFIPKLYEENTYPYRLMVLYLSGNQVMNNVRYEDYGVYNLTGKAPSGSMVMRYHPCYSFNLNQRFDRLSSVILLPTKEVSQNDCQAGWNSDALNPMQLEDNHLQLALASSTNEATFSADSDFLTVAFYDRYPWNFGSREFELVAVDKTKYYFQDSPPAHQAPISPQNLTIISFTTNSPTSTVRLSWSPSVDNDTLDSLLRYELSLDSMSWRPINLNGQLSLALGGNYSISLRTVDEFGNVSEAATVDLNLPPPAVDTTPHSSNNYFAVDQAKVENNILKIKWRLLSNPAASIFGIFPFYPEIASSSNNGLVLHKDYNGNWAYPYLTANSSAWCNAQITSFSDYYLGWQYETHFSSLNGVTASQLVGKEISFALYINAMRDTGPDCSLANEPVFVGESITVSN